MRIGIDARFITHPQKGGFKTYTQNLVCSLAKIDTENEFIIYLDRPIDHKDDVPQQRNFKYKVIHGEYPLFGMPWREQICLSVMAAHDDLDLLHSPCLTAPLGLMNCHSVVTVHDTIWLDNRGKKQSSFRRNLMNDYYYYVSRRSIKNASLILTVSNFSKSSILKNFKFDANLIKVVYEAANPIYHKLNRDCLVDELYPRFKIKPGFIFGIGSTDPRKNMKLLINAYASLPTSLQEQYPLVLLCTNRVILSSFQEMIINLGLENHAHLIANVSDLELLLLYNSASLFVFPSITEGFGLPLLEAMACGTPVVAANNSSIPEIVGDSAILVDNICYDGDCTELANNMCSVLSNPEHLALLSLKGLERVKMFSWDLCAEETLRSYELVKSHS